MKLKEKGISRRDFIKRTSQTGIALAATGGLGYVLKKREKFPRGEEIELTIHDFRVTLQEDIPDLVVVKNGNPSDLVKAAINEIGGMEKFISRGDVVVIKPNVGWDRVPQQAANTNPEEIKTVVELCFNAGAKKVIVSDNSCNDARRCFRRSGIANAVKSVDGEVMLPEQRKFKEVKMGGNVLDVWPVFTPFLEADKFINMPIAKHHNLVGATIAMKNLYGVLGGRRNQLHQNIHESIADLANFIRPTLVILDAYRILLTNGPQGGNIRDTKEIKIVAVGLDQVAIDAYGVTLLGRNPEEFDFLKRGQERGLGNMNLDQLNIKTINLS